ncbi:MAG: hypothetical protein ACE5D8_09775 [Fidelibacterota bacterium]
MRKSRKSGVLTLIVWLLVYSLLLTAHLGRPHNFTTMVSSLCDINCDEASHHTVHLSCTWITPYQSPGETAPAVPFFGKAKYQTLFAILSKNNPDELAVTQQVSRAPPNLLS